MTAKVIYSDFFTNFTVHPENNELVRYVNEGSIKRSLRNLLQTDHYERLMQPAIGSNLKKLLFEPMTNATAALIQQYIQDTVTNNEPRVSILSIIVTPDYAGNLYDVKLSYAILNTQETGTFQLKINRLR